MKIKVKEFRKIIHEGYKNLKEFHSIRDIKIVDRNGLMQMINPENGQVLVKDASQTKYKDFLKLFKELGVESVTVSDTFDNFVKSGSYSKRNFLNKLAQLQGIQVPQKTRDVPIITGDIV